MNKSFPFSIIILLLIQSCGVTKNTTATPIFRHVNLNFSERIELGDNFNGKEYMTTIVGESYFLKSIYFGGVESIEIILDDQKRISKIIFEYDESSELQEKIRSYQEDLGNPKLNSGNAIWNDNKTQFEVYNQIVNDKTITYSKLIDLKKK